MRRKARLLIGYDIIGDVHGRAALLEDLLIGLGYRRRSGVGAYQHQGRQAIFVGDLIDGGPHQCETLELVKAMVDHGSARAVMGNHEFNAIAYATGIHGRPGAFLLAHTETNTRRHQAFLDQLTASQRSYYVTWFQTLPLWLDLGDIRVVHACWHEESRRSIEDLTGSNRLTAAHFVAAATKGGSIFKAVDILLNGPELNLSDYDLPRFRDWNGEPRATTWVKWWRATENTVREVAEAGKYPTEDGGSYPTLPSKELRADALKYIYTSHTPVFFGHYSRDGTPDDHRAWDNYAACLDFSGNQFDTLVAYRWNGEPRIRSENFVYRQQGRSSNT